MRKHLLVIGIIFLFVGASVVPATFIINENENILKNRIEGESETQNNPVSQDVDWWPMYHHDLYNTGYSSSPYAPETNNIRWIFEEPTFDVHSAPAVVKGKVYIGCSDGNLFCIDANSGNKIWKYNIPDLSGNSPAVYEDKVYIQGGYYCYCINANTGDLIWKFSKDDFGYSRPAPVAVDDKVFFAHSRGSSEDQNAFIYCLDADTGEKIWKSQDLGWFMVTSPAFYANKIYIGSQDSNCYCFDASTGSLIWSFETNGALSSPGIYGNKIYFGSGDGKLYCLDVYTGNLIWFFSSSSTYCSPGIAYDMIYYGTINGDFYCLNALNGSKIWEYNANSGFDGSSPAIADGKVYVVSSEAAFLLCLDAYTGDYIWSYNTPQIDTCPAIADGRLYVGGAFSFNVYCFGNSSEPPSEPSIDGSINGTCIIEYDFTFNSTDPEKDNVSYWVDWGDASNSGWVGYYPSGQSIILSHKWSELGFYTITAKAKDEIGSESNWSDPFVVHIENIPPDPPIIDGPVSGKPRKHYYYEFSSVDSEGHQVYYFIDWGDKTSSGWFGPYDSEYEVRMGHTWNEQGIYKIKIKAKDTLDAESNWSEFDINIPRSKATIDSLFQLLFERFPLLEVFLRAMNLLR